MYRDIQKYLGDSWEHFQSVFKSSLKADMSLLSRINSHIASKSGKQLRPMLSLLTARLLGHPCDENIIKIAVASEMLHTATLIHDDVADNSNVRRGFPTVKAVYGSTAAVLVGDYWLSKVIENVVGHPDRRVLACFAKCLERLAEGEILQIEKAETLDTSEEDYYNIIYSKTASLFETAMLSAAYSVGADEASCSAIKSYAFHYGRAFQIMDDIFDYSPELNTGKPFGQDIVEKKITLPLLGVFRNVSDRERKDFLSKVRKQPEGLSDEAINLVRTRGGIEYAMNRLHEESLAAAAALDCFRESEAKSYLKALAAASRLA